jgi:elongation factor P
VPARAADSNACWPTEARLFPGVTRNAMMIKATDIRRGMVITIDGTNFVVVDFAHHTPGNLRAMVQTKLRNMNSGALIEKRLRAVDQVEVPYVETKEYEYLYSSGDEHVFMDTETYDQLSFPPEILGTAMQFLLPNSKVMVQYVGGKPVSVEVPASIDLVVTDTPPSIKGATATNQYKDATLETGLRVQVPPFIGPGEKIRIDTRTGEYIERVK